MQEAATLSAEIGYTADRELSPSMCGSPSTSVKNNVGCKEACRNCDVKSPLKALLEVRQGKSTYEWRKVS